MDILKQLKDARGGASVFDLETGRNLGSLYDLAADEITRLQAKAAAWDGVCDLMRDPRYSNEAGGIYVRNHLNANHN